jgi:hypothetical protein
MATQRVVAGVSLVSGRRREVSEVAVAVDPLAAGDRVAIRGQLGYRNEAGVSFLGMAWLREAWSWTRRTGTRIVFLLLDLTTRLPGLLHACI